MAGTDSGPADRDPTDSKVGQLLAEYNLEGLGADLESRWTGEAGERESLRTLATSFNISLLEQALREADATGQFGSASTLYRTISGEEGTEADRTRTIRRLERAGVDVDALESDFVSYQAIRTYLRDYRGAEYEPDAGDLAQSALESVQKLRNRLRAVTESTVNRLTDGGPLAGGDYRVSVDVRVSCENCGSRYDVTEFLREGGCSCKR